MRKPLHEVLLALAVTLLPHLGNVPHWVVLWCLGLWLYVAFREYYNLPLFPRPLRAAIALFGFIAVLSSYGSYSVDMCISLLIVTTGTKPIEARNVRDRVSLVGMGFFLVLTGLFYSQSLLTTLYLITCVWLLITVLIRQHDSELPFQVAGRFCLKMLLQAAPLTLLVFLAFPRVSGSLWGFSGSGRALSGFSDVVSPGDVSRLAQDNSVAFRVKFNEAAPDASDLYWRGIVFDHFDGRRWTRSGLTPRKQYALPAKELIGYTVTVEPHQQNWLFALDYPIKSTNTMLRFQYDLTVSSTRPIRESTSYSLESSLRPIMSKLKPPKSHLLQMPEDMNPRTARFVRELLSSTQSRDQIAEEILDLFAEEEFYYTLNPETLGKHSVDEFLFDSRRGYCEHYASSFAYIMRSVGIPARLVGGYVGGEYNPVGDYYIVKQSDAHVWTEIWLEGVGWKRIDPTSAVAPTRVEEGLESAVDPSELGLMYSLAGGRFLSRIWKTVALRWDVINYNWDRWMMSYDRRSQRDLLERFGINLRSVKGALMVAGAVLLLVLLTLLAAFFTARRRRDERDQVTRLYERFLFKLNQRGVKKPPHMGPVEFSKLAIERLPDKSSQLDELISLYADLRYATDQVDAERVQLLEQKIREI